LLADIMVVHTEVEFVPLYVNQPLFAEVDQALRKNGFLFHRIYHKVLLGRAFKPFIINNEINRPLSQVLWADAIYVKNFMDYDSISAEKLLKLAVIMHDIYDSYDLVHYILQHYDKQTSSKCAEQYLRLLCTDGNL